MMDWTSFLIFAGFAFGLLFVEKIVTAYRVRKCRREIDETEARIERAEARIMERQQSDAEMQMLCEREGGAAALAGKTLADCPYAENMQRKARNCWLYGCENALTELEVVRRGKVIFRTAAATQPGFDLERDGFGMDVIAAMQKGLWKPQFVTLEMAQRMRGGK